MIRSLQVHDRIMMNCKMNSGMTMGIIFSLANVSMSTAVADAVIEVARENNTVIWWKERVPSQRIRFVFQFRIVNTPANAAHSGVYTV